MKLTHLYFIQMFIPVLHVLTIDIDGDERGENIEYVNVHRISGKIRRKRSTGTNFPQALVFQFEMEAGIVELNLQRSVHPRKVTPVYTIEGDTVVKRKDALQNDFGVYQDPSLGASVIVKSPYSDTTNFELFGSFSHESRHYQIEPTMPLYRKRRSDEELTSEELHSGTIRHRIRRQSNPYGDFAGDELLPPPDNSNLNGGYDLPPFPGKPYTTDDDSVPIIQLQMSKPHDHIFGTTTEKYESDVLLPHIADAIEVNTVANPRDLLASFPSRRRRQADETLYIEYLVVIDYKNLERWKSKVGGSTEEERVDNAFNAMHEYYQFVVNGIDVRFRTATGEDGPVIRVNFATLLISTEESTSPWIKNNMLSQNSVDDAGVLLDFATWKNSVIQYLPAHDHAGLFTGFDIATPSSLNPIGMGYLNSICHNTWAVSEIEETYNAVTIHIAAHELGHNVGTRHDGNGNSCPSSSLYLMAPRLPFIYNSNIRTNPWTFSSCSQNAIKIHIAGLSDNCLTNVPAKSSLNEDMPGLQYTADQQCNMTYGNDAVLCRDDLYYQWDSICYAMQCKKKGDNSCTDQFFPFDGTPCGDQKWCQSGNCVSSEDAPSYNEACLFGDDPNVDCTSPSACDDSNIYSSKVRCCGTCSQTTSTPTSTLSTTSSTTQTSTTSSTTLSTTSSTSSTGTTPSTSPPSTPSTTLSDTVSTSSILASSPSTSTTSSQNSTELSTTQPALELSFELQTMISLFISSVLVI